MKIKAKIFQDVTIDPVEVLEKLIIEEIGEDATVKYDAQKRYIIEKKVGCGNHICIEYKETTEDVYLYISSILLVKNRIAEV